MAIDKEALANKIRTLEGLTADDRAALLGLLRQQKRYGLVWEDKPEDVEERMLDELPVLTEVKDRYIKGATEDSPNHILIEGDNLHALTALTYTHAGKIDVIYIDPPYNTGNRDFKYNDQYVDREDEYRHSKWISFMAKRLRIAKQLLSNTGMIFISIDDNEQSQLKILCDEIFSQNNFINVVSIKAKSSAGASGGGEDKKLKKNIEYILIYVQDREKAEFIFPQAKIPLLEYIQEKRDANISWSYTNVMYKDGEYNYFGKTKAGNGEDIEIFHVTNFEIKSVSEICELESISEEEVYNKYIDKIFTTENAQTSIRGRIKDATPIDDGLYVARYYPTSGRNKGKLTDVGFIGTTRRLVSYLKNTCIVDNGKVYKLDKIGTLWSDLSWSSVSKEGGISFPAGKKPISLIKRVISMHPNPNAMVLDFFTGSGSTAHATMDLNDEDDGKRIAIICNNNENGIIEQIAYPRCKNVIKGYGRNLGLIHNSLRYYRTDFVPRQATMVNMRRLMQAATDLLCIKEDLYDEQNTFLGKKWRKDVLRYFAKGDKSMVIVYNEKAIEYIVPILEKEELKSPIKIYVFSPSRDPYSELWDTVREKVVLCALPAAIYDAYKRVLKKPRKKYIDGTKNESTDTIENEPFKEQSLFDNLDEEGGEA